MVRRDISGRDRSAAARVAPLIQDGRSTLVAAPNGSGKTLTAFLATIDTLVGEGRAAMQHRYAAEKPLRKPRIDPATLDYIAMTLLRRYGGMFWRLLEREATRLPSWRELLPVYHRLQARGDLRGERFVSGFSGGQFALPEAIPLLRSGRRCAHDASLVCISGVDPLNVCGTLRPGDKVPALTGKRILFRDGLPMATITVGKTDYRSAPGTGRGLLHAHLVGRRYTQLASGAGGAG